MTASTKSVLFTLSTGLVLLAFGCKGSDTKKAGEERALIEIHEMYALFAKRNSGPPKQISDLVTKEFEISCPEGWRALKDGKYIGVYGVAGTDSSTLQAYAKDVPTQGGQVLMADGTIRTMTAEEFKTAKK
jgi:hypothetical protein